MKIKHYASNDARLPELREKVEALLITEFGTINPEALVAKDKVVIGDIEIPITIHNNPLVYEGHTFELLREFYVDFGVLGKSKVTNNVWSNKRIAEVALVHWVSSKLGTTRTPKVSKDLEKIKLEKELLKNLKSKPLETPKSPKKNK